MKNLIQNISRQQFALFICCGLLVALVYSKYMLSVGMISLLVLALIDFRPEQKIPIWINPAIGKNFRRYLTYPPYLFISLYFFIVLLSGFYSEDSVFWLERLRLKIPFLLAPFAFASIPAINRRQYLGLFYFLLILLTFSAVQVGFNYWQNFAETNQLLLQGQAIKTPMSHIRYSLLIALSILGGLYLISQKFYWKYEAERFLIMGLTLGLFLFIHILSVRSGLIALYLGLILWSLVYILKTKKIGIGILSLSFLILLPFLAYQYIPSFEAKVRYAVYDFKMYTAGAGDTYSDSERIISLQLGMQIGLEHPIAGVGAGDLRQEMEKAYAATFPDLSPKLPHNQWISVFVGTGLLGLIAFALAFFYPLFYQKNYRDPLLLSLHLVIFLSFLMENTLETSIGIALYLVPLLLSLNYLSNKQVLEQN